MRHAWPFVDRASEIDSALGVLAGNRGGVILFGPAGVGRTALQQAIIDRLDHQRVQVITIRLTENIAYLRGDGFRALLTRSAIRDGGLSTAIEESLRRVRADDRQVILSVDDLHRIDETSAVLLYLLVTDGAARLVANARLDQPMPPTLASLWREDRVRTIPVGRLSDERLRGLLDQAAGAALAEETATRLISLADGDLVVLRENLEALLHAGRLTPSSNGLRWSGDPTDLVTDTIRTHAKRFAALAPQPRAVVALTALAEPVGVAPVTTLTSSEAVRTALADGLIAAEHHQRRLSLRVTRPVVRVAIRQSLDAHECWTLLTGLAEVITGYGARRADDLSRLARWHLDHGVRVGPIALTHAAGVAFDAHDLPTAARLSAAALAEGAGFDALDLRANTMAYLGDERGALELLDRHADLPATPEQRLRWHLTRSVISFVMMDDTTTIDRLRRAAEELGPAAREILLSLVGCMLAALGDHTAGEAALRDAVREGHSAIAALHAEAMLIALGVLRGVPGQAEALPRLHQSAAPHYQRWPTLSGLVEFARWKITLATGIVVESRVVTGNRSARFLPLVNTQSMLIQAITQRHAGDLRAALDTARQAGRMAAAGSQTFIGPAAAETARVAALLGDRHTARAAMMDCDRAARATTAMFAHLTELARIQVAALDEDLSTAITVAERTVRRLRAQGLAGIETAALHALVRLGTRSQEVVDRAHELAERTAEPLHALIAEHAAAVYRHDPDGLRSVAIGFHELGMLVYALEATAQRFRILWDRRAVGVGRVADELVTALSACPALGVPALRLSPPRLTPRRWQVAELAAAGVSTTRIAALLHIEEKTVESHLYRIYPAMSVPNRTELPGIVRLAHHLRWRVPTD